MAVLLGVLALALVGAGAVWAVRRSGKDRHLAKMEQLRKQLTDSGQNISREQRGELFQQMGREFDQLPPEEKRKIIRERGKQFRERIDKYFALGTPEERLAYLDSRIDESLQRE